MSLQASNVSHFYSTPKHLQPSLNHPKALFGNTLRPRCSQRSIPDLAVSGGRNSPVFGEKKPNLAEQLRLGSLAEDGLSFKEKFIVRSYEVGVNKTATVETIANLLQISQWLAKSGLHTSAPSYHAVHLDLIGHVKGLQAAENYFDELNEENKTEKTYSALFHCYAREQSIEKSMSLMEKMKELGFVSSVLIYNSLMSLYTNTCQYEKVPTVLEDMKKNGAFPDIFSYRICLNSYGARSDLEGMERVIEEMENQPLITKDWNSYAVVANVYIKAGLFDKAIAYLKKSEANLGKGNGVGCCHLISLYACLGDKSQMQRLWGLLKTSCRMVLNRDYLVMLRSLVTIRELTDAENLLEEWESSGNAQDPRVPNVLVAGYCEMDLVEKAEEMVEDMVKKGKYLSPNSWGIISLGYLNKGEIQKAVVCMKKALLLHVNFETWKPKPEVMSSLLRWLGDEGEVEEVEGFMGLLKNVIPMDREMYHALIKANIRAGRGVDAVLQSMKADSIDVDEEIKDILNRSEAK